MRQKEIYKNTIEFTLCCLCSWAWYLPVVMTSIPNETPLWKNYFFPLQMDVSWITSWLQMGDGVHFILSALGLQLGLNRARCPSLCEFICESILLHQEDMASLESSIPLAFIISESPLLHSSPSPRVRGEEWQQGQGC